MNAKDLEQSRDKLLFTPGPLTTSAKVKEAALHDLGSRDSQFLFIIRNIRQKLLDLANADSDNYDTVIMQGSGTFGVEAVISSAIPASGKLLNIINGAYGRRISQMAKIHSIPVQELEYPEDQIPSVDDIEYALKSSPDITHVSVVHCETTTGILNPVESIGKMVAAYNKTFIVDAMSSFGACEIEAGPCEIGYLISSSNKCIEGIPGFSFVIAKKTELARCKDQSRTLSLNIYDQWSSMNANGQFRFTPPVQSILAFSQALHELDLEGGIKGRSLRYMENNKILIEGMTSIGFRPYLAHDHRSYIITSFLYPDHPNFTFGHFYSKLNEKGFVIYPGKLSMVDCFRIGNIGRLFQLDIKMLLDAIEEVLFELDIDLINNQSHE